MKREVLIITFILCMPIGLCKDLYAWGNIATHPAITHEAIRLENSASEIDDYLKTQLGLTDGIETELEYDFPYSLMARMWRAHPRETNRSILEWIEAGSIIEDELLVQARSRHHFHDPIR